MYFILLLKLGCMLSGCHLKMYITKAQLRLAKTGQAFAFIFSRISGERSCVGRVGMGMEGDGVETERRASASMTRAKTKITICSGLVSLSLMQRERFRDGTESESVGLPAYSRFLVCPCRKLYSRQLGQRRSCRMGVPSRYSGDSGTV